MTSDQLTPEQKAASGSFRFLPGARMGSGSRWSPSAAQVAKSVGTYGWDGGMGTSWYNDPAETSP